MINFLREQFFSLLVGTIIFKNDGFTRTINFSGQLIFQETNSIILEKFIVLLNWEAFVLNKLLNVF